MPDDFVKVPRALLEGSALTQLVECEARNKKYPLAIEALEELKQLRSAFVQQEIKIKSMTSEEAALFTSSSKFVKVPQELTEEMVLAGCVAFRNTETSRSRWRCR